jgi:hypothetical protein
MITPVMATPSDSGLARVVPPSVVIQKGNRLWSVFERRWVELDGPCDVKRTVILVPPHSVQRQRAGRRLARRARWQRRRAAFLVVQAVVAAALGFIVGTGLLL